MTVSSTAPTESQTRRRMYWLHALEPLHVGAGAGVGFIDLPIMREAATGWPFVPGSAFKGVWADSHRVDDQSRQSNPEHRLAFGRADDNAGTGESNSGSLMVTDARLVCFPVRSLYGTFAWCTCPLALARLHRDLEMVGLASRLARAPSVPGADPETSAFVLLVPDNQTRLQAPGGRERNIYLGELDFVATADPNVGVWADALAGWLFADADANWRTLFRERFAVVPDDVFTYLTHLETQVDARVRIRDETKTVDEGALWYEESLPAETILAGYVACDRLFRKPRNGAQPSISETSLLNDFCKDQAAVQIGGKATVGRGIVALRFTGAAKGASSCSPPASSA